MTRPIELNTSADTTFEKIIEADFEQIKKAKIMMVDDEMTTMNVLKTFLKESGFNRFALIEKPTEAMAELENFRPDLLLLDLIMPEVSGFEILQKVRELEKFENLPIIILTSSSDKKDKLLALAMGATDFLAKPIAPSELQLLVTNTLAAKVYVDHLKSMEQDRLRAGYAGIAAIAHWLKGGGAMVGFDEIAKTPDRLAALAKNGNDKAQVAKLLSELLTMAVRQVFPTVEVSCSQSAFEGGVPSNPIVATGEADTPSASDEPEKPVISRLSADPRFQNTIAAFIRKLDKQLLNMEAAFDKGDLEDLAILAHWLKGAGGTVGYDDFTRPATSLFSYAKSDQIEPAGRMLRKIQRLAKSIVPPSKIQDNRTDIN